MEGNEERKKWTTAKGRWLGGITAAELIARSERFWSGIAHEGVLPKETVPVALFRIDNSFTSSLLVLQERTTMDSAGPDGRPSQTATPRIVRALTPLPSLILDKEINLGRPF